MAQIGHVYKTESTLQTHTGNLTYTTKFTVDGTDFAANTEYIMWLMAQVGGSNTNGRFKFRTQIGAVTPEGAEMIMEPNQNVAHSYVFMHKFTTGGTPDDVTFQIAPQQNIDDTANADSIVVLALSLDDLAATDWFFGEDTTDGDHSAPSAFDDRASITFTPGTTGQDWLIIAWGSVRINSTGKQWRYRISRDADAEIEPLLSQEGEDGDEELCWMLMRPFNLDNTEHIFKVQSNDDSASGQENEHNISKIFALRLQAFEDVVTFFDGGTFDTPDALFNEIADLAFTATTTGKGVVLGTCCLDVTAQSQEGVVRAQIGGTTEPVGKDSDADASAHDTTDILFMPLLARFDITASSTADVDIDAKVNNAAADIVDRGFAAFSLELAPGGDTFNESAALAANATLAAAALTTFEAAAALAADGTLAAAIEATLEAITAAITANGTLAAAAGVEADHAAALDAVAALAAEAGLDFDESAALDANAALAAAQDMLFDLAAALAADALLVTDAIATFEAAAALAANSQLAAAVEVTLEAVTAAMTANATLVAAGGLELDEATALDAVAVIVAAGDVVVSVGLRVKRVIGGGIWP